MLQDREDAARQLASRLSAFRSEPNVLVLGLPRGGVPMASIVAHAISAELDICLVRKLGVPWQPELALGALSESGVRVLDESLVRRCGLDDAEIARLTQSAQGEIDRRAALYRSGRPPADARGRLVIVVDDGAATGSTMLAAIRTLRAEDADRIVIAVPVAPPSTVRQFQREADEVVCLETHEPFYAVGRWYQEFGQVDDVTVQQALQH